MGLTVNEEIEKKKEIIRKLREEIALNIQEQEKIYLLYLKKLKPIIDFIKNERYFFTHPDFNEVTALGPILGKDRTKNLLFYFDLENEWVRAVDMYNPKSEHKIIPLANYFENYDFEVAMNGLLGLLNYQDKMIEELQKFNEKTKNSIRRYKTLLDEESK